MSLETVDSSNLTRLAGLGQRVLDGGQITPAEGEWLFNLESTADIFGLMSWANRIREHFKGNKIHLCSIVNVKAGGCSENCRFCSQSAAYQTESPRYGLIEEETILHAAEEAKAQGVTALGLVAAWRGIDEGPVLDEICDRLQELKSRYVGSEAAWIPPGTASQINEATKGLRRLVSDDDTEVTGYRSAADAEERSVLRKQLRGEVGAVTETE